MNILGAREMVQLCVSCSCRKPKFSFLHPHQLAHDCLKAPFPEIQHLWHLKALEQTCIYTISKYTQLKQIEVDILFL